ncbi:MAG TPA: hypothetical protein VIM73_18950 [Polyangiaceae bacterium]
MSKDAELHPLGSALRNARVSLTRVTTAGGRPRLFPRVRSSASRSDVVPIYWDPHFRKAPADAAVFDEFLRTLFHSSWMTTLGHQGVPPVRLLPSWIPSDPAPVRLTQAELEQHLVRWQRNRLGRVSARSSPARNRPLFLVVTPRRTELTFRAEPSPKGGGVTSYVAVPLETTGGEILEAHALIISRRLARALVARTQAALD